jgi:hypothetical protein
MPETSTPTKTAPPMTEPITRPYVDPGTIRQPGEICPQQKREQGWEAW